MTRTLLLAGTILPALVLSGAVTARSLGDASERIELAQADELPGGRGGPGGGGRGGAERGGGGGAERAAPRERPEPRQAPAARERPEAPAARERPEPRQAPAAREKPEAPAARERPEPRQAPAAREKPEAPAAREKPEPRQAPAAREKPDAPAAREKPEPRQAPATREKPEAPAAREKPEAPAAREKSEPRQAPAAREKPERTDDKPATRERPGQQRPDRDGADDRKTPAATTPNQPASPATPQQPNAPTAPNQRSGVPGRPVQPGTPPNAAQPGQQPTQPNAAPPASPATPQQPNAPTAPNQRPGVPGRPVQPGTPPNAGQPGQQPNAAPPASPATPQQPNAPTAPNQRPGIPGRPVQPGTPPNGIQPDQQPNGVQPGQPGRPGQPNGVQPQPNQLQPNQGQPQQDRSDRDRRDRPDTDRRDSFNTPGRPGYIQGGFREDDSEFRDYGRVRRDRREYDVDGRTYYREPGRIIVRDRDGYFIRHDENERFRDIGRGGYGGYGGYRSERRGVETFSYIDRPGGEQIVTVVDDDGRLVRRYRRFRDGREVYLINNSYGPGGGGARPVYEDVVDLPPPDIRIPRERYVVDYGRAEPRAVYGALTAPPVQAIDRRYTLDQVRYSPQLRARMPSVDINTITFESGAFVVPPDQARLLQTIADGINQAVQGNPQEVFLIEGYTDAVGEEVDNLSLSDRRAQSVATILTQDFKVPPENLTTQGYGEQNLKVQTQEANRENRRVTVRRITPLLQQQAAEGQQPAPPPQ